MHNENLFHDSSRVSNSGPFPRLSGSGQTSAAGLGVPRQTVIGLLLIVALFAFELFNFDTTRFALGNLLGDINFLGLRWAAILAIAFCAIDFAGLAHLFTPERGLDEPKEIWYLMGAWLLGATMNALMTWWAVSLTLLEHQLGNEVLSKQQLLQVVPPFVAVLVWLTRILFIGAFSVAGEHFFQKSERPGRPVDRRSLTASRPGALPDAALHPLANLPERGREQPRHSRRRPPIPQPTRPVATLRMSAGERRSR